MLSQKRVLAPELEINWYAEDDDELAIAAGFGDLEAGIRLRYEIRKDFAPYIGINYEGLLADTRDLADDSGEETGDTQLVAGLRSGSDYPVYYFH